jgi:papain like protease
VATKKKVKVGLGRRPVEKNGMGRRFSPNQQDLGFIMRERILVTEPARPKRKTWAITPRSLDQGETSTCVGFAWRNFLRCAPIQTVVAGPSPWEIYRQAVLHDEWPDNDKEGKLADNSPGMQSGTCIRAGSMVLTKLNRARLFLWAFELPAVVDWVLLKGPMVIGVNWYDSMFEPDAEGIIHVKPGSRIAGGHALLIRGVDTTRALATLENSWGDAWGINGSCFIQLADLDRLLAEDGEGATAVELKL